MPGDRIQLKQWWNAQTITVAKPFLSKDKQSEQGLSLLECLVGIVVVAAVIAAITPGIFLTMATRVQNRRADQAKQLAQAEVDKVRRLVERGTYSTTDLNNIAPVVVGGNADVKNVLVPFDPTKQTIDINGDGKKDFWVQTFRNDGIQDPNSNKPVAFKLGVRVYTYFQGETPNPSVVNGKIPVASLTLTTAVGSQKRQPLMALYTDVALSDTQNSLDSYKQFLQ